ncbi:MAG: Smr/MutS family protein [candidate division KSB1 bacterium]|nr:Smr/MutS family protein [candidate division KSB1 bacterium]
MSSNDDSNLPDYVYIRDVLDLHGTPYGVIPELLDDFIGNAIELGYSRVRIIHGKGRSRLKHYTHQQLDRHKKVYRYYDAPPALGGWGATIAELIEASGEGENH